MELTAIYIVNLVPWIKYLDDIQLGSIKHFFFYFLYASLVMSSADKFFLRTPSTSAFLVTNKL